MLSPLAEQNHLLGVAEQSQIKQSLAPIFGPELRVLIGFPTGQCRPDLLKSAALGQLHLAGNQFLWISLNSIKKKYQIANKYMDYMGGIIWAHLNLTILILGWHVREPTQPHVEKPALILQQQPNLLWHCIMSYHLFRVLSMALPVGAISTREAWKSSFPGARRTAVLLLTVQDQSVKRRMTQVPSTEAGCFEESDVPSFATSDHRILWGCFAPWNLHTRRSRSEITKKAAWKFVGY